MFPLHNNVSSSVVDKCTLNWSDDTINPLTFACTGPTIRLQRTSTLRRAPSCISSLLYVGEYDLSLTHLSVNHPYEDNEEGMGEEEPYCRVLYHHRTLIDRRLIRAFLVYTLFHLRSTPPDDPSRPSPSQNRWRRRRHPRPRLQVKATGT